MKNKEINQSDVLAVFSKNPQAKHSLIGVLNKLKLPLSYKNSIHNTLKFLIRERKIYQDKAKKFALKQAKFNSKGTVDITARGFYWFVANDKSHPDALISRNDQVKLMAKDEVLCEISLGRRGYVAKVIRIIKRNTDKILGIIEKKGGRYSVNPLNNAINNILITTRISKNIAHNSVVEVKIIDYPSKNKQATGEITNIIGKQGDLNCEIEKILLENKICKSFTEEVEQEANKFSTRVLTKDIKNRVDICHLPMCTIDGESAKDFDDALYAKKIKNGFEVYVAIADVSHYVRKNTALDDEAFKRATSIYFPGQCIPMLPNKLSAGLCSLMPKVKRLCVVVQMEISNTGKIKKSKFYQAVMKSHARLTYNNVQQFLDTNIADEKIFSSAVKQSLKNLESVALLFRNTRQLRGAIDFDITQSVIALDDNGEPISIHPNNRLQSHKIVEDLMVATNEVVAHHLLKNKWPAVFRVHEAPSAEKIEEFLKYIEKKGLVDAVDLKKLRRKITPKLLASVKNNIDAGELDSILNILLLRSMMQAKYSEINIGHFGLASKEYLHFTSPIRRYPDLLVHRALMQLIKSDTDKLSTTKKESIQKELAQASNHSSERERLAVKIERKMDMLFNCWYMKDKIGEEDNGIISGCTEFGIFVRLNKYYVEGLVHITSLGAGRWIFDETLLQLTNNSSKKIYQVGQQVKVKIAKVDIEKCFIDLSLAELSTD